MENYAYVENGQVAEVYYRLPDNWRNISNFSALETNIEENMPYLNSIGWHKINKIVPEYNPATQKLDHDYYWVENGLVYGSLQVIDLPPAPPPHVMSDEEKEIYRQQQIVDQWNLIRSMRDELIKGFEWRYNRYNRQIRMGVETTDRIEDLDSYIQALADITNQSDPYNIHWPNYNSKT